jgi:NADH-quinone oxidoreductase subunit C
VTPSELAETVSARWPDTVHVHGEVTLTVLREELTDTLEALRADEALSFDFLSQVTASDWPEADPRFWLDYELYSLAHRHRLRVKVGVSEDDPRVPSVVPLFPTADWHERETFDLFGIVFDGHPDLRRILLPEGWDGYPLRKTEELGGVRTFYRNDAFIPPVDRRTT